MVWSASQTLFKPLVLIRHVYMIQLDEFIKNNNLLLCDNGHIDGTSR
jgi:hypothetical protein